MTTKILECVGILCIGAVTALMGYPIWDSVKSKISWKNLVILVLWIIIYNILFSQKVK